MFSMRAMVRMGDKEFVYDQKGFDNCHTLFLDFLERMKQLIEKEAKKEGQM